MVRGSITEADLKVHDSIAPVEGPELRLQRDGPTVRIGQARIVKADIPCTNGMIHLIDGTLI